VRGDLLEHGLGQVVPDVPTVPDLQRVGQSAADRFGVGAGAVSAHHLHAGMGAQPRLHRRGQPVGQDVDALAGLRIDQDARVLPRAAQREVVDAEHARHRPHRQRQPEQRAQGGVTRCGNAQRGQDPYGWHARPVP
jgi:hypothetical protein